MKIRNFLKLIKKKKPQYCITKTKNLTDLSIKSLKSYVHSSELYFWNTLNSICVFCFNISCFNTTPHYKTITTVLETDYDPGFVIIRTHQAHSQKELLYLSNQTAFGILVLKCSFVGTIKNHIIFIILFSKQFNSI